MPTAAVGIAMSAPQGISAGEFAIGVAKKKSHRRRGQLPLDNFKKNQIFLNYLTV
jgi:hypothetical protein